MKEYLNKPLPFIEKKRHQIIASFLFALFIYLFLVIFQPFGISNILFYKPLFILGFAFISFVILLVSFWVVSSYFKTENWTVKKNIIFICIQFLIITVFNWIYNSTIGKEIGIQHSLLFFVLVTVSVGIIPTLFLIHFIEKYLTNQNQNLAINLTNDIQQRINITKNEEIRIISKNRDEAVKINLEQFICAKSEGNYIKVFYKENDKINSKLLRNSISNLEEQIVIFNKIKRCHRSFIINFENVDKVTGNARNFSLHVNKLDFTIPISRSFPKETLNELIQ